MSKAARTRQQSARARIAAERAAARRAQVRNRVLLTGGSILVVIAIVVTFVVIKSGRSTPSAAAGSSAGTVLPASVSRQVTSVPASTLNAVGGGSVIDPLVVDELVRSRSHAGSSSLDTLTARETQILRSHHLDDDFAVGAALLEVGEGVRDLVER